MSLSETTVKLVFQLMGLNLHTAIASHNPAGLTEEEKALVEPLNLFQSPNQWEGSTMTLKYIWRLAALMRSLGSQPKF